MSDRLSEIKARLDAATPGPWKTQQGGSRFVWKDYPDGLKRPDIAEIFDDEGHEQRCKNALLIAAAPEDLRYLLARLERAEMALREHMTILDEAHASAGKCPECGCLYTEQHELDCGLWLAKSRAEEALS